MGKDAGNAPVSPAPTDPTRSNVNMSYPPDQSIYSNPITSNQQTSQIRSPGGLQTGALPNMQMSPQTMISSPNSVPQSPTPMAQTLPAINPNQNA